MAKRRGEINPDLFAPTGGEPESETPGQRPQSGASELTAEQIAELVPQDGFTRSVSVGLRESELALLDEIAEAEGVARNAIMRFMLRREIALYRLGRLELPIEETKSKRLRF
jgi:hypothetical protein